MRCRENVHHLHRETHARLCCSFLDSLECKMRVHYLMCVCLEIVHSRTFNGVHTGLGTYLKCCDCLSTLSSWRDRKLDVILLIPTLYITRTPDTCSHFIHFNISIDASYISSPDTSSFGFLTSKTTKYTDTHTHDRIVLLLASKICFYLDIF